MARRKQYKAEARHACRDCKHSYDWHEKNWRGELFMCRCRIRPYSRFLDDPECEKFELKNDGEAEQVG